MTRWSDPARRPGSRHLRTAPAISIEKLLLWLLPDRELVGILGGDDARVPDPTLALLVADDVADRADGEERAGAAAEREARKAPARIAAESRSADVALPRTVRHGARRGRTDLRRSDERPYAARFVPRSIHRMSTRASAAAVASTSSNAKSAPRHNASSGAVAYFGLNEEERSLLQSATGPQKAKSIPELVNALAKDLRGKALAIGVMLNYARSEGLHDHVGMDW